MLMMCVRETYKNNKTFVYLADLFISVWRMKTFTRNLTKPPINEASYVTMYCKDYSQYTHIHKQTEWSCRTSWHHCFYWLLMLRGEFLNLTLGGSGLFELRISACVRKRRLLGSASVAALRLRQEVEPGKDNRGDSEGTESWTKGRSHMRSYANFLCVWPFPLYLYTFPSLIAL